MDDCREQQLQELDALESMYANELNILCRDFPNISVEISIRPDSAEFTKIFGDVDVVRFRATLPADYPNIGPQIDMSELEFNADDGNENGWKCDAETAELLIAKVKEELDKMVEESLGLPMLFTLINTFQESLFQVCADHSEELADMAKKKAEAAEKEEVARFEGTRVTVESFNKWNETFLEKMRIKKLQENKDVPTNNRLTGKQLFLADKSLNISDLQFLNSKEEDEEEETVKKKGGGRIEIDQALFEDDLDLSDGSSDDEEYKPDISD